jgi:hypothetical protein
MGDSTVDFIVTTLETATDFMIEQIWLHPTYEYDGFVRDIDRLPYCPGCEASIRIGAFAGAYSHPPHTSRLRKAGVCGHAGTRRVAISAGRPGLACLAPEEALFFPELIRVHPVP